MSNDYANRVLPEQRRLTKILLDALQGTAFVLAGSGSLRENGIIVRETEDIDIFTRYSRPNDIHPNLPKIRKAFSQSGYTVESEKIDANTGFSRFFVKSPSGLVIKVEFSSDFLNFPAVPTVVGPVSNPMDASLGKINALTTRGLPRDYVDIAYILNYFNREDQWVGLLTAMRNADSGMFVGELKFKLDRFFKVYSSMPKDLAGVDYDFVYHKITQFYNWLTPERVAYFDAINDSTVR